MKIKLIDRPDERQHGVREEEYLTRIVSQIVGDDASPGLGTLAALEVVKRRRRDALRIIDLTQRATEALGNLDDNLNALREKPAHILRG